MQSSLICVRHPSLSKEERNRFRLQDLAVDIVTVNYVFMVSSTQPVLCDAFLAADFCHAGGSG
jgi:hypothetical protein